MVYNKGEIRHVCDVIYISVKCLFTCHNKKKPTVFVSRQMESTMFKITKLMLTNRASL